MDIDQKLICESHRCRWVGLTSEALSAPNPFVEGEKLIACPQCREQTLCSCCDESGCTELASCGTPVPNGYRWTCYKHRPSSQ